MLIRTIILVFLSLAYTSLSWAQQKDIEKDTSYLLESALKKAIRHNKDEDIVISAVYSSPSKKISTEKNIVYKNLDGRVLHADLFYPKKLNKKTPGILIIHGGGWKSGDKVLMTPMAEKLAETGYFVMAPEYRLSPEAKYPAAVLDLYDAFNWMVENTKEYKIDTSQFIVMGCSAGGQLAALVGTTYNSSTNIYNKETHGHIAAIIDVDGVLAFKHPDSAEGQVASEWLDGTYEENPVNWEEASALNHVDAQTPPTLFLASKYPRFLAGRQNYIQKLEEYQTPSETYFLNNAPHSFWLFNPWFKPTVKYVQDFLDEYLTDKK